MLCVFFSPACQEKRKYKNAKEEKILKSSPLSFAPNFYYGFFHRFFAQNIHPEFLHVKSFPNFSFKDLTD